MYPKPYHQRPLVLAYLPKGTQIVEPGKEREGQGGGRGGE